MTYHGSSFGAISDSTRLAILQALAQRQLAVGELAKGFPMSRPAISQHLRILSDAGLVSAHKRGTQRVYEVNPAGLTALKAHFDQFWESILSSFQAAVESPTEDPKKERRHGRRGKAKR